MRKRGRMFGILFALLLGLSFISTALAEELFSSRYLSFYGTYLSYGNSRVKDWGYAFTLYGDFGDGKTKHLEGALSQLHINYESPYDDLDQTDFTLAYNRTGLFHPSLSLRLGFHYISTDDNLTDQGWIFFGDLTYLLPYNWNTGLEIAYSRYHEEIDLDVFQLSPHIGYFLDLSGRKLYLEARGYYIHVDETRLLGTSLENYYSLEATVSYTQGPWTFKASGWIGQQMFAVKQAGFVVYNLTEKYHGGLRGEISHRRQNRTCGLILEWAPYREVESSYQNVNLWILTAFIGFTF